MPFLPPNQQRQSTEGKSLLTTLIRQSTSRAWLIAVYYKSVSCNPLTPLLRFVVDLLYNLFLQLRRFWLTYSALCGPSAVADLLVPLQHGQTDRHTIADTIATIKCSLSSVSDGSRLTSLSLSLDGANTRGTHTHTHTHPFNGRLSGTTRASRCWKGKTNVDFTEAVKWVAVAAAGPYASLHLAPDR